VRGLRRGWAWLLGALLALVVWGCGAKQHDVSPKGQQAGLILNLTDGWGGARVFRHCDQGRTVYTVIGHESVAVAVVDGCRNEN